MKVSHQCPPFQSCSSCYLRRFFLIIVPSSTAEMGLAEEEAYMIPPCSIPLRGKLFVRKLCFFRPCKLSRAL